jgi:hypothetical protein
VLQSPTSNLETQMKRVTGIGGTFFQATDPVALRAWYQRHLGIDVQEWGGAVFTWSDEAGNRTEGTTVWSISATESDYFAPSTSTFMISIESRTWLRCFRCFEKKGTTSSTRRTTPSTESSAGSRACKEARSSCGSRRPVNELGTQRRRAAAIAVRAQGDACTFARADLHGLAASVGGPC